MQTKTSLIFFFQKKKIENEEITKSLIDNWFLVLILNQTNQSITLIIQIVRIIDCCCSELAEKKNPTNQPTDQLEMEKKSDLFSKKNPSPLWNLVDHDDGHDHQPDNDKVDEEKDGKKSIRG